LLSDDGFDQCEESIIAIPDLVHTDLLDDAAQDSIHFLEVPARCLQLAVAHKR
jgi:hypothetical protein